MKRCRAIPSRSPSQSFLALLTMLGLLTTPVCLASNGSQEEAFTIDLHDAELNDVLDVFASMTRAELAVDPELGGKVTISLYEVSWMTALDAVCESVGCRWQLAGGNPRVLTVTPHERPDVSGPELSRPIDLHLERARDVFESISLIMDWQLRIDGMVLGKVSLRVNGVSLRTTLNAACESIDCRWELDEDRKVLTVTALQSTDASEETVRQSLEEAIGLKLEGADATDVFKMFGQILGCKVVISPEVSGRVTVQLDNVPAGRALTEICAQVGCRWSLSTQDGAALLELTVAD